VMMSALDAGAPQQSQGTAPCSAAVAPAPPQHNVTTLASLLRPGELIGDEVLPIFVVRTQLNVVVWLP